MIVNSKRGPLNCNEYDSGFDATDRNAPAAGKVVGLIHASTDTVVGTDNAADDATVTRCVVPANDAALSASLVNKLGAPRVTPP